MKYVNACAAVLLLGMVLVLPPWLLWNFGVPLSFNLTDWFRPDDGHLVLGLLTFAGWISWLLIALSVAAELATLLLGKPWQLPGLGWLQTAMGALLLATLLFPQTAKVTQAQVPVSRIVQFGVPDLAQSWQNIQVGSVVPEKSHSGAIRSSDSLPDKHLPGKTHVVQRGESLWQIAETFYGDGFKWQDIAQANADIISDPQQIDIGMKLVLPGLHPDPVAESHVEKISETLKTPVTDVLDLSSAGVASSSQAHLDMSFATKPIYVSESDSAQTGALVLGISSMLAGGLLAAVRLRNALRNSERQPGYRFIDTNDEVNRLAAQLAEITQQEVKSLRFGYEHLQRAQQAIKAHCIKGLPALDYVVLGKTLEFHFMDSPGSPPEGFVLGNACWQLKNQSLLPERDELAALAWPALITAGKADDEWILIDPVSSSVGVSGESFPVLAAWLLELNCNKVPVIASHEFTSMVQNANLEQVDVLPNMPVMQHRINEILQHSMMSHNLFPENTVPEIVISILKPDIVWDQLRCSQAVGSISSGQSDIHLELQEQGAYLHTKTAHMSLVPQAVEDGTLQKLCQFLDSALDATTEPAWWWKSKEQSVNESESVSQLDNVNSIVQTSTSSTTSNLLEESEMFNHPIVQLLGPIDIINTCGPAPARARKQCVEYAAWILEHPGCSAALMSSQLVVAESTRRSNMSRLRSWLGTSDAGVQYLPEAYTGRIKLAAEVTSDWQHFCMLLLPGVNRVSDTALQEALDLVRGAPLADAAPTGWIWAQTMRQDMIAMICDAAHRLAEMALDKSNLDLARWAAGRGLAADCANERLLCDLIRADHLAGDYESCHKRAFQLERQARAMGVDLMDSTIDVLQEVMEGSIRARRILA